MEIKFNIWQYHPIYHALFIRVIIFIWRYSCDKKNISHDITRAR